MSTSPTPSTPSAAANLPPVEKHIWTEEELMAEVHPKIREALEAFRRDLPEMMKGHHKQWVAYYGANRLGFGDKTELYQRYQAQGYDPEELFITTVEPEDTVWYI
jgi:hypothetical protein